MKSESPLAARIILGIVAAMAMSIPLAITLKHASELTFLQKTAKLTVGSVTAKQCENHGKLTYSYAVDGRVYTGSGTRTGQACLDVGIGDRINIIYSAEKPQLSRCDSVDSWRDEIAASLFGLALISLAAVIGIFRITRIDVEPSIAFDPSNGC